MAQIAQISFGSGAPFVAGESGASIKVKSSSVMGSCGSGGKTTKKSLETDIKYNVSKSKLTFEILETDWSQHRSLDVPNDTVTHRARNWAGLYKDMPGGRSLKCEVALSKIASASQDSSVVELKLKSSVTWYHQPNRSYGPFGERGGPFVPCPADHSSGSLELLVQFSDPLGAAELAQALVAAREPAGKKGKKSAAPLLPLGGQSFVFTGDGPRRAELEDRVSTLGGKVSDKK